MLFRFVFYCLGLLKPRQLLSKRDDGQMYCSQTCVLRCCVLLLFALVCVVSFRSCFVSVCFAVLLCLVVRSPRFPLNLLCRCSCDVVSRLLIRCVLLCFVLLCIMLLGFDWFCP